ncbi:MAG: hypothetical protein LC115_07045 [Bacteroidia bacterium]|nr:hypothetical protein [Bacteroidia bacterium]
MTISFNCLAQNKATYSKEFYLHSIADTVGKTQHKDVVDFWVNYLYEENDSVRQKYWLDTDIKRFGNDYSLFYNSLFQYPPNTLLNYFKPYILSIYLDDTTYHIVTAFMNFNFAPNDTSIVQNSNPFAITEIGVVKKNNEFYLSNLFDERTQKWVKVKMGKIRYIIDPLIAPNETEMLDATKFIDNLSNIFSLESDSITYVVCKTPQNLGYLIGFNFFFSGFTTGKTFISARMIVSGKGSFNYPHELTHILIDPILNSGNFISEGIATYFGGSANKTYKQLLQEFYKNHYPISADTFNTITAYANSPASYTLSALIIDIIYNKYGIQGVLKLKKSPDKPKNCLKHICVTFDINENNLFKLINELLINFAEK